MTSKQSYTSFFGMASASIHNSAANITCTNCSGLGHTSKACSKPIMSYGALVFRVSGSSSWNQAEALTHGSMTGIESSKYTLEFLLIQRRDSIGFIEIMRGKYKVTDHEYILQQIAGMTEEEREKILHEPFHLLWEKLWGPPIDGTHAYRHEKEQARQKLEAIRTSSPSLAELVAQAGPAWPTPEWGFPKGRRDMNESEFACAMREMWEETNIGENDVIVVRGMEPLEETYIGTNNVTYSHKYYIAYAPPGVGGATYESAADVNEHIRREVGSIRWCGMEEATNLIRVNNHEKRQVLLRANSLLRTYCPLILGASPRWTAFIEE